LTALKIVLSGPFRAVARTQYGVETINEYEGARSGGEFLARKVELRFTGPPEAFGGTREFPREYGNNDGCADRECGSDDFYQILIRRQ